MFSGREGVHMRKLTAVILIFAMTLSLCGCRKTKVKMLVKEYRSGFGITGQDFSGYREYEVKNIKEGDVIEIAFGTRTVKAKVLSLLESTKKDDAKEMYELL